MKKLIIITILLMPFLAKAQKLTYYEASNGKTYHIGDTILLGNGSGPNGKFQYIQIGGWAKWMVTSSYKGSEQYDLDKNFSGSGATIKKIKVQKLHAAERWVFVVSLGNITNYDMYIEDAIANCEIKDCNRQVAGTVVQQVLSPADELAKFKKLLDAGAITQAEYDAKKKQLLGL